jgi:hypothetical protein
MGIKRQAFLAKKSPGRQKNLDNPMKTIVEKRIFLEIGFMKSKLLNLWWWWWDKKGGVCP